VENGRAMAILLVTAAFLRLGVSFWPYMIPYSVTVQLAAAPTQSLEFLFWGAGVNGPKIGTFTQAIYGQAKKNGRWSA
jgi:cytochrome bd ubiquinol oxidase subunit II